MKRLVGHLYFWVLLAIVSGGVLGYVAPATAVKLKPLGDGFIALVKMLISPVIFCTVVLGITGAGDMKKVGRVGGKALLYFEVLTSLALVKRDIKGKLSITMYAAAVPMAFVNQMVSVALYVAVAIIWFVPDRRIEANVNRHESV